MLRRSHHRFLPGRLPSYEADSFLFRNRFARSRPTLVLMQAQSPETAHASRRGGGPRSASTAWQDHGNPGGRLRVTIKASGGAVARLVAQPFRTPRSPARCGARTTAASRYVGPSCTMAPGRRTASPLQETETCVVETILRPTGTQRRGDPVGRPSGAGHAGPPRRAIWGHRARRRQRDAPRRPYMPCVQPRGCDRFQGARHCRAPTPYGNVRGCDDPPPYRHAT